MSGRIVLVFNCMRDVLCMEWIVERIIVHNWAVYLGKRGIV